MSFTKKKKWWLLFVTTSGTSLVFMDNTVMPVALPAIEQQMGFSSLALAWVVNAYLLSLTSLLLIAGRLSDLFGKRFLFMWGLSLFGAGSILAALSHAPWTLLLGRIVQGAGGALIIPTISALLISTFGEGERAKALGINSGISSVFLILGPILGGFLTQYISWRSIFFLNIPLVLFGIIMAAIMLNKEEKKQEAFHFSGAFTMLIGIVLLVVGLMQGNDWGWYSPATLSLIILGPLFFGTFIWNSTHTAHPIIDFHLFHNPLFSAANISIFVTQVIAMVTVLWAIYFQEQLNYSAVETGLLIVIAAFPVFMMAPLGGYMADRLGARIPLLLGFGILIFALLWLLVTSGTTRLLVLAPGLLGFGCGLPLIMSPTMALALSQSHPEKLGQASGISTATRQLASTTGMALMTAVYHGGIRNSGSKGAGFSSTALLGVICAVFGFLTVYFLVRKKEHSQISEPIQSNH